MTDTPLAGVGVLVTRPQHQAGSLVRAVENAGGEAIRFPVLEIVPREPSDIAEDAAALASPDIAIFVSSNAVRHGLDHAAHARIAAVGPATAKAIADAGATVDILSATGFDSEHLLAKADLTDMAGKTVRIIRGQDGRDLLGDTLQKRGAQVDYLAVYERRLPEYDEATLAELAAHWQDGDIDVVTVMSVASLNNLIALTPPPCLDRLARTPLVTPASRVLKEALNQFPDIPAVLSRSPDPAEIVQTIGAIGQIAPG